MIKITPTVVGIIYDPDKKEFLLMKKEIDGIWRWQFVQGSKEKGETNEEALKREIFEETGIKDAEIIEKLDSKSDYWYIWEKEKVHKFCVFFLVKAKKTMDIKLSEEHTDFKWCNFDQALESIKYNKEQLQEAKKIIEKEGI